MTRNERIISSHQLETTAFGIIFVIFIVAALVSIFFSIFFWGIDLVWAQEAISTAPEVYVIPETWSAWLSSQPWWGMVVIVSGVVLAVANAITGMLPSHIQGNVFYNIFMKILNTLAYNRGKNTNADDKPLSEANRGEHTL